jgi:hypothetical protein
MLYVPRDMDVRSLLRRPLRCALLAFVLLPALGASAVAAGTSEIEGVWSFNGGAVAIQGLPDSTFQGTVVTPTTFAECQHPAGQVMWTDIQQQADNSFWGLHQWYYEGGQCQEDPVLGATAWRVIHTSADSHYLEVCFSSPGTSQPKIAPDGAATEDTYGCVNSALISELPVVEGENGTGNNGTGSKDETGTGTGGGSSGDGSGTITFAKTVVFPNATACFSQTSLKIKLRDPKYDPLTEVLVKINGKKVADFKGIKRLQKGITLKKLPGGTYKISVVATTVLKQHLSGSQTYKSCTKGSGTIGLKRVKKHHHHG